jgi:hypothetical protein
MHLLNYTGQQPVSGPHECLLHTLLLSILGHPIPPKHKRSAPMPKSRPPTKPRRPRAHSLLPQYGKRSQNQRIAAIKIEDPYDTSAHSPATAVAPPQGTVTDDGPAEWQAPARPRIEVLAAIRDDVAAKMFARRQIDDACFLAARAYQTTYERAEALRRVKSVDLSMPPISGAVAQFEGIDNALRAAKELKRIERELSQRAGDDGVELIRDVLGAGKTIESAARERGDDSGRRMEWWGGLFRRCLRHLAEISGFAVQGAYRNLHKKIRREREVENTRERNKREGSQGASFACT